MLESLTSARRWIALGIIAAVTIMPGATQAGQVTVNGRTFTVPDGFTVELVAGQPLVDRPITADFDEQGRLYVADSSGSNKKAPEQAVEKSHRIVRLSDVDAEGRFKKSTLFADQMSFPEGTLWHEGSLYVAAVPSIWKLTEGKGKDAPVEREEWFAGKTVTGCGNDLHGPYLGLDGMIYWAKGAFAKQTYDRPGHKPLVTRASHILRARPDGKGIEAVMTGGMDNPVEVAFTPGGERIVSNTFLVNPAAGKRDGLIHAIYGGVYGKVHDVIEEHPRTGPEVMPVLSHLGPSASCGLARYESDAFGEEYRDNLFSTSFNLRKVFRHVLKPSGGTFISADTDFLTCDHLDFHPTHLCEDADGSLLVVDTGGWYKICCPTSQLAKPDTFGAIYRVRRTNAPKMEDPRGLKLNWYRMGPAELALLLDDPRPAVRKRAVATLAKGAMISISELERVVESSPSAVARLNAVWAATRIASPGARMIVRAALKDADETVRNAAAHSAGLWRDGYAINHLCKLMDGPAGPNRRAAAEAIGRIGGIGSIPSIFNALSRGPDPAYEHSLIYALIEIDDPKVIAEWLLDKRVPIQRAAMIALDQMEKQGGVSGEFVAAQFASPDAKMRDAAIWIAGRHKDWSKEIAGALREKLMAKQLSGQQQGELSRILPKLAKNSTEIQELLAAQVADQETTPAARRLALNAMTESELRNVPESWLSAIAKVLAGTDVQAATLAATAARKLTPTAKATELIAALHQAGARADLPGQARLDAMVAIPASGDGFALSSAELTFLLTQLKPNQQAAVRLAAAEVVSRSKLTAEQLTALLPAITAAGALEIERLIAPFGRATDAALGQKLLATLKDAKSITSLRSETLKAKLAKYPADVQKEAESLYARLNPDAAKQKAHIDELVTSLPAGDIRRGQVVFNNAKAACVACHTIGYVGGKVGPDLTRIGAIRQERDLLEAIVYPSASFVQSYEPVIVETKDGDTHSGVMKKNDAEEILLATGPDQEVHIPRKDVKEMRPGAISVMPAGLEQQITPQELADLVAFLKGCK